MTIILIIIFYFVPTMVAGCAKHRQFLPIFVINVFSLLFAMLVMILASVPVGVLFLAGCWLWALIWSLTRPPAHAPLVMPMLYPGESIAKEFRDGERG